MRPLKGEENEAVLKKLANYIGENTHQLLEREGGDYGFLYHLCRVYYCSEELMRRAVCIPLKKLKSIGTCIGKFTKGGRFFLHITALDYLAPYAKVGGSLTDYYSCCA